MNGKAAISIAVGSLFIYSGLRRNSILAAMRNLIKGQGPGYKQASTTLGSDSATTTAVETTAAAGPVRGLYDHASLMTLWTDNGGPSATANNAACHGIQESSGNPAVTSSNPDGGTNVGLWQLDTKGVGAGHPIAWLQDPNNNCRLTIQATNGGQNWSEWATPGC